MFLMGNLARFGFALTDGCFNPLNQVYVFNLLLKNEEAIQAINEF